jgi:acyl-CoA synthetase (AMP-forming)/AMP-acid ligase II
VNLAGWVQKHGRDAADGSAISVGDAVHLSSSARAYVFLDALPKNNYGKVLKTELRREHGEAERAAAGSRLQRCRQ